MHVTIGPLSAALLLALAPGSRDAGATAHASIATTLGTDGGQIRQFAFDGDGDTFFASAQHAGRSDHVTVAFDRPVAIRSIRLDAGRPDGTDALDAGTLEYSRDGDTFAPLAEVSGGPIQVDAKLGEVRAIRVRPAEDLKHPLAIREVRVESDPPVATFRYPVEFVVNVDDAPELKEWAEKVARECERYYPEISEELKSDGYRPPHLVHLTLSRAYNGVAMAGGTRITGSVRYYKSHPDDVGSMIHEATHVVQQYRSRRNPSWLVEGVADYVRFFKYEPGKIGPIDVRRARYDRSYRVTAAFLAYLADKYDGAIVPKLNALMRRGEYREDAFKELTGKTVQDLGDEWLLALRGDAGAQEKPAETPADKAEEKAQEKPAEKAAEKPAEKAQEKPAEKAQEKPAFRGGAAPIVSPEVQADRRVTFRLRAPDAKAVTVSGEWGGGAQAMTRDERGTWTATVGPLAPDLYGYSFSVDGFQTLDPGNPAVKPMRSPRTSILEVPGDPPRLHEYRDVPHGTVRIHQYRSRALGRLRGLHVYTPPGYDRDPSARFPVLYLFHGSGDNEATWTALGRAHLILDNLQAEGKTRPMIVVMPDGHAATGRGPGAPGGPGAGMSRNVVDFERDLLEDVIPFVESNYRTRPDPSSRAIAGLSMGGGQSLTIGLNHPDRFAWVGGFSAAVFNPTVTLAPALAEPKKTDAALRLVWIACGKDDRLIEAGRQCSEILKEKGIRNEFHATEGNHSWPVWRRYLADFAPLLFVEAPPAGGGAPGRSGDGGASTLPFPRPGVDNGGETGGAARREVQFAGVNRNDRR